jgi:hypothetical protein
MRTPFTGPEGGSAAESVTATTTFLEFVNVLLMNN